MFQFGDLALMIRRLFGGFVIYLRACASTLLNLVWRAPTSGKYAVIIGINYVNNPRAALLGCCNDARAMHDLIKKKGFKEENIKMLIDDDDNYDLPNCRNVKKALNWLCSDRKEGDVIFMHFSGHGTQIPADDDDIESDKLDEAIVLEELFLMADDDLKQFFSKLPYGVKATVVTDCCHSGTMLDGTQIAIEGSKDDNSVTSKKESGILLNILGGSRESHVDQSTRSLPISTICEVMSEKRGKPIQPIGSEVNRAMAEAFGGIAGKLMMKHTLQELKKQEGRSHDPIIRMLVSVLSKKISASEGSSPNCDNHNALSLLTSETPRAALGSPVEDGGECGSSGGNPIPSLRGNGDLDIQQSFSNSEDPIDTLAGFMGDIGIKAQTDLDAPRYTPLHETMTEDVCALITGCQANETSADVRPSRGKAFGALTKTLTTVHEQNSEMSHYDLVRQVRKELLRGGFSQNPCLECSNSRAEERFIC